MTLAPLRDDTRGGETTSYRRVVNSTVFETGSGNVFADLGLPDAEELLLKAQLMHNQRRDHTARIIAS